MTTDYVRHDERPDPSRNVGLLSTKKGEFAIWVSPTRLDGRWDDFLRSTKEGQFQQSSLWAEYKAGEGWRHHRIFATDTAGIAGGFQLLWKKVRGVACGYVSKGPVTRDPDPELEKCLVSKLQSAASELGLAALIVQPPDASPRNCEPYAEAGFIRSNPMQVVEATYLIDVRDDLDVLRSRMSTSLRRNLRAGKRRGVIVREGGEADLPRFFELMSATCQRQRTAPNPSSLEAIQTLWRLFAPTNSIRLILAVHEGSVVAAKLNLHFGTTVTVWKKGWDGTHGDCHPNEVLEEESIEWAHAHGFHTCDLCSFDLRAATAASQGEELPREALSSRDEYHLRLGGRPQLLPASLVFIPNRVIRWTYRTLVLPCERRFMPRS